MHLTKLITIEDAYMTKLMATENVLQPANEGSLHFDLHLQMKDHCILILFVPWYSAHRRFCVINACV